MPKMCHMTHDNVGINEGTSTKEHGAVNECSDLLLRRKQPSQVAD